MSYLNQRPKVHGLSRRAMRRPQESTSWRGSAREGLVSALRWQYRDDQARTQEIVEAWQDWWDKALDGAKRVNED